MPHQSNRIVFHLYNLLDNLRLVQQLHLSRPQLVNLPSCHHFNRHSVRRSNLTRSHRIIQAMFPQFSRCLDQLTFRRTSQLDSHLDSHLGSQFQSQLSNLIFDHPSNHRINQVTVQVHNPTVCQLIDQAGNPLEPLPIILLFNHFPSQLINQQLLLPSNLH